ncbi:hypothetical protein [Nocardia gipuzkoensis]|uniref:hypothetical protein n=1 Tax=Nocardia gipuzkoensis TaxID=2749991 RepID=UPI001F1FCA56|nr:hypothetical protein [Nocardia gipuzkoensis]
MGDLAAQIRTDAQDWTPSTAPHWARPLLSTDPTLLGELAVWRASLHIDDRDMRPTGPTRYSALEREHQQLLDTRVTDAIGDIRRPVNRWAPTLERLDARIVADPYWPVLADKIDIAARAGLDIETLLTDAATQRPLPDEMPAAALWSRLQLEPSALDTTTGHRNMRPDWITDLHAVLGDDTAERVITDPAWPRVVAAIDRATATGWTPDQILSTAHELLLTAQPDNAIALRPDQLANALAWRIDALLHHTPAPANDTTSSHEPHPTTMPETTNHPTGQPNSDLEHARNDSPHVKAEAAQTPVTEPAADNALGTGLPEHIRTMAQLMHTGQITAAVEMLTHLTEIATDEQRAILADIAETLYRNSFPVARARLRWAGERYPQHRALIEACTPDTDPHVYQPGTARTEPAYQRERRHDAARDHHDYINPAQRRDPLTDAQIVARRAEQDYVDTRADVDDQPYDRVIPDGVVHHYYREALPDDRPKYYALDYDLAAVPHTRWLGCVACGLERTRTDATPVPPRRADDGLCGECRDNHVPGIPDHDPTGHITARCDHITTINPAPAALAMLRRDWRATHNPAHRVAIEAWVRDHPLLQTAQRSRPQHTTTAEPAVDNPLLGLTDAQLNERIDQLHQSLALADTDAFLYGPAQHTPDHEQHTDELIRRHTEAQQAIRDARTADQHLHTATRAFHAIATELADTRATLEATASYRRSQRRTLQTRIDVLVGKQIERSRDLTTARDAARQANREAILRAGTPENWNQLLRTDPADVTHHGSNGRIASDEDTQAYTTDVYQQLHQYKAEQRRRQTLTTYQLEHEHHLRAFHAEGSTAEETAEYIGLPAKESDGFLEL